MEIIDTNSSSPFLEGSQDADYSQEVSERRLKFAGNSELDQEDSAMDAPKGDDDGQDTVQYYPRPNGVIYPGDFLMQFRKLYTEPPQNILYTEVLTSYQPSAEDAHKQQQQPQPAAQLQQAAPNGKSNRASKTMNRGDRALISETPAAHWVANTTGAQQAANQQSGSYVQGTSLFHQDPLLLPIRPLYTPGPAPVTHQLFGGFAAPAGFPTPAIPVNVPQQQQAGNTPKGSQSPPESRLSKYLMAPSPIGTPQALLAPHVTAAMSNLQVSPNQQTTPQHGVRSIPGSPKTSPIGQFWRPNQQQSPMTASPASSNPSPQSQASRRSIGSSPGMSPLGSAGPSPNASPAALQIKGSPGSPTMVQLNKGRKTKSAKLDHGADHTSNKGMLLLGGSPNNQQQAGNSGAAANNNNAAARQRGQEANVTRLNSRQRQIDIGKNTIGYKMYLQMVPREKRSRAHPKTPDKLQLCSKRSWDGQIRKWRRQIHFFDPEITEEEKKALQDLMIREALSADNEDDAEGGDSGSEWEEETPKSKEIALNALLKSVAKKASKLKPDGSMLVENAGDL